MPRQRFGEYNFVKIWDRLTDRQTGTGTSWFAPQIKKGNPLYTYFQSIIVTLARVASTLCNKYYILTLFIRLFERKLIEGYLDRKAPRQKITATKDETVLTDIGTWQKMIFYAYGNLNFQITEIYETEGWATLIDSEKIFMYFKL